MKRYIKVVGGRRIKSVKEDGSGNFINLKEKYRIKRGVEILFFGEGVNLIFFKLGRKVLRVKVADIAYLSKESKAKIMRKEEIFVVYFGARIDYEERHIGLFEGEITVADMMYFLEVL